MKHSSLWFSVYVCDGGWGRAWRRVDGVQFTKHIWLLKYLFIKPPIKIRRSLAFRKHIREFPKSKCRCDLFIIIMSIIISTKEEEDGKKRKKQ